MNHVQGENRDKQSTNLESFFPFFQFQISHAAQTEIAYHGFFVVEVDVFTL